MSGLNMIAPAEPAGRRELALKKPRNPRMGLRTSATFATIFTVLGHTVFGFEQSWAQVVVALIAGHTSALFFESVDAWANDRRPAFRDGGVLKLVDFMLAPHMTSITMSFLIYVNQRLWIMALACVIAIGSKYVLRVRHNGRLQHFMNPSNAGIAVILVVYQWTGMLPWGYTVDLHGAADWIVPLVIVALGVRLNILFTGRMPTVLSWLSTFIVLAIARAWLFETPVAHQLVVLTGIPMVLFTLYMITDPQTSPSALRGQIGFGSGIAVAYSSLLMLHVQYTMFYSVTLICAMRGCWLAMVAWRERTTVAALSPAPLSAAEVRGSVASEGIGL